jgi:hypothetical protein
METAMALRFTIRERTTGNELSDFGKTAGVGVFMMFVVLVFDGLVMLMCLLRFMGWAGRMMVHSGGTAFFMVHIFFCVHDPAHREPGCPQWTSNLMPSISGSLLARGMEVVTVQL